VVLAPRRLARKLPRCWRIAAATVANGRVHRGATVLK
jgi:hypothetical protein